MAGKEPDGDAVLKRIASRSHRRGVSAILPVGQVLVEPLPISRKIAKGLFFPVPPRGIEEKPDDESDEHVVVDGFVKILAHISHAGKDLIDGQLELKALGPAVHRTRNTALIEKSVISAVRNHHALL